MLNSLEGATIRWVALPAAAPTLPVAAALGGLLGTRLGSRMLPVPVLCYALAAVLMIAGAKLILS